MSTPAYWEYEWLHIPTGKRGFSNTVSNTETPITKHEFLGLLDRWNGQGFGVWQYRSI